MSTVEKDKPKRVLKKTLKQPPIYSKVCKYILNNKSIGQPMSSVTLREELLTYESLDLSLSQIQNVLSNMTRKRHLSHESHNRYVLISRDAGFAFKAHADKLLTTVNNSPVAEIESYFWLLASTAKKYTYEPINPLSQDKRDRIWIHTLLKICKHSKTARNTPIKSSMNSCVIPTRIRT